MIKDLGTPAWAEDYRHWFTELKQRAVAIANRELIALYWKIGRNILDRQQKQRWGGGIVDRLARGLNATFPDTRGFSPPTSSTCERLPKPFRSRNLYNSSLHNCSDRTLRHCSTSWTTPRSGFGPRKSRSSAAGCAVC
ncbi:DUF1016 N-terminal domain-containing protein [Burkholderia cepacia]|uniref:DUF1016 N-terminal domain-containing protein n=1 Tax=Burkholderia cepacia TaxID=292 RepID=UPI000B17B45A|nr:DUF1016 N-terminal domain-containing protein [Burkholderia cepacia]